MPSYPARYETAILMNGVRHFSALWDDLTGADPYAYYGNALYDLLRDRMVQIDRLTVGTNAAGDETVFVVVYQGAGTSGNTVMYYQTEHFDIAAGGSLDTLYGPWKPIRIRANANAFLVWAVGVWEAGDDITLEVIGRAYPYWTETEAVAQPVTLDGYKWPLERRF